MQVTTPHIQVAHLHVLTLMYRGSFAHVAVNAPIPYVKPNLTALGSGNIDVHAARHPCVELQDNTNFIPNNYRHAPRRVEAIWCIRVSDDLIVVLV